MKKIALLLLLGSSLTPASAAGQVASHAMVVAGQAGAAPGAGAFACATSGPQAREGAFFNTGIPLPAEGYGYCNLAGGIRDVTLPSGTALSSQGVTFAFNGGTAALAAQSRARFDGLGVQTQASFDGAHDSRTYSYAEAAAYAVDRIPLPGSGMGSLQVTFDIDGSAQGSQFSDTLIYLNYQFGNGPIYTAFVGYAGRDAARAYAPTVFASTVPGFSIAPGTIAGAASNIPSFQLPVTLGAGLDLSVGLYAASYVGNRLGELGVANVSFLSTARLSGFFLHDSTGALIDTPLRGESGTIYDRFGAHVAVVPEPSIWALMLAGFLATGFGLRRKNQHKHGSAGRAYRLTGDSYAVRV